MLSGTQTEVSCLTQPGASGGALTSSKATAQRGAP